jgi:hypothetical protein
VNFELILTVTPRLSLYPPESCRYTFSRLQPARHDSSHMSSSNPNPVYCTIDAGLWSEIISFVANNPVEPPHNESVTTYQQIYRVSRHLLGRLEDSHVTSNIPGMHELQ